MLIQQLKNRPNLFKAVVNTGWLFADRILRMGVGLLVGVWVARYLGPEQFGLFNYASAFVALFGAVAGLGLNGIVVRDLVKQPEQASITLGTTFLLQILGGLLALLLAVLAINWLRPDEPLMKMLVIILASVMVFKATETVKFWFESQVQSKYCVWVENAAFLIFAAIKVILILQHAPLIAFVWVVLGEAALVAVALLGMYAWKEKQLLAWRFDGLRAKQLLKDSWPLILSGLAIMVYMRIDQIMLGQMLGDEAVGIYSAASKLSEIWYFIPIAINSTLKPKLILLKNENSPQYEKLLKLSFSIMIWLSISIAIVFMFLSDWIINILYGSTYKNASNILIIHIWAGVFVFLNNAAWNWYYAEDLLAHANIRLISGLILNISLNYVMIPLYGGIGAAWATLISRAFVAYFGQLLNKKTRRVFIMMTSSLVFK